MDRDSLLELLEGALSAGMPSAFEELPGWTELDAYERELEQVLEELPPVLTESPAFIRAHANARMGPRIGDEELGFVAVALQRWLSRSPDGVIGFGPRALEVILPLICSWSATVVHALAGEPLSLVELDRTVTLLGRETLEEHVAAMERVGQVEALPGGGGSETRYTLTDWGREAIAPIVAAVGFERRNPEDDVAPPDVFDAEAAFQMALPPLQLPSDLRGSCRLGVQIPGGQPQTAGGPRLMAGATAEVDRGGVVSSSPLLEEEPETWATGSPLDWCETVVDPGAGRLVAGGDTRLTAALIEALHETMFGEPER